MHELTLQVKTYLKAMWRHRWLGLGIAWLVGIISAVAILRIPDKYEASARIYVDTQSILQPLMSGLAIQPNVEQAVMMLSRTLISRPNVDKLIRMADLDLAIKSKTDQEALADRLMKTLEIKSTSRDNLYTLAFSDSDPEKAKRVVQSLVSIFVESSLGSNRKDTETAKQFIDDQIKDYEKKLEEAENRLKDFKLRNLDFQMAEGKTSLGQLGEVSNQLNQARLELREAENSRDAMKRQIVGEDPMLLPDADETGGGGVSIPEIDSRIESMKRNLDEMLRRYTEEHPDVVGTRRVIKDLEEEKRKQVAAKKKLAASNPARSISNNPVYQQLRVSLAEAEGNVASLHARVAEYESRFNRIRGSMKATPEVESEYSQLNRDYDVLKQSYQSLVSRREAASMSGNLEARGGGADFRLIDPPRVSPQPVAPNRLLLLLGSLLVSLAAGIVTTFAASQLRPVFFDGRSLRDLADVPLLGTISLVESEPATQKGKKDFKRFLLVFAGLIGAYAVGFGVLFMITGSVV